MPEPLKQSEVQKGQDPSVMKQWDDQSSPEEKFKDFYSIADNLKICLMATNRSGVGPVARSMAIAKRSGPDFFFLANANSKKFEDIESNKTTSLFFQDSSNQDWISITGEAVTANNEDPRIEKIWSRPMPAWFGDLGDGVHNGGPKDPRMKLIEVQPSYIAYYKHEVGKLGFFKEVGQAVMTGDVAQTGTLRQMKQSEIEQARKNDGDLST